MQWPCPKHNYSTQDKRHIVCPYSLNGWKCEAVWGVHVYYTVAFSLGKQSAWIAANCTNTSNKLTNGRLVGLSALIWCKYRESSEQCFRICLTASSKRPLCIWRTLYEPKTHKSHRFSDIETQTHTGWLLISIQFIHPSICPQSVHSSTIKQTYILHTQTFTV